MSIADTNKNNWVFQEFLFMLGYFVQSNLMHQIDYLKVENKIMRSKLGKAVFCTPEEKRRLVKFAKPLGPRIKDFASIVTYETIRKWIRGGIPSKKGKGHQGRPRTPEEIRELVVRLARENDWGYTRIIGELKKLGIKSLSKSTVKRILRGNGIDPAPKRGEDSWDEFIKRHFKTLYACDFFTKTVWTLAGQKTFFVLFFINVHTRKIHIAGITRNPNGEWLKDKVKPLAFLFESDEDSEKLLIRDGDKKFTKEFNEIIKSFGVRTKRLPYKSPNLNPYSEAWVGTIKRECLGKFYVFGEEHLKYLVDEYVDYYNTVRPHSGLDNNCIDYEPEKLEGDVGLFIKLCQSI